MQKTRGLYLLPNVSGIYYRKKSRKFRPNMYSVGIQVSNSMLVSIADRTQACPQQPANARCATVYAFAPGN